MNRKKNLLFLFFIMTQSNNFFGSQNSQGCSKSQNQESQSPCKSRMQSQNISSLLSFNGSEPKSESKSDEHFHLDTFFETIYPHERPTIPPIIIPHRAAHVQRSGL